MEWKTMTTPATDGKVIVNTLYHSAVVSGLAMGIPCPTWQDGDGGQPPEA